MTKRLHYVRRGRIEKALEIWSDIDSLTQRLDGLKELIGSILCGGCDRPAALESFCFGCRQFICQGCDAEDASLRPAGPHGVEEHKVAREEEALGLR